MSGDAIDRLRKSAQNEQTIVGMSHLLRAKEIELIQLREALARAGGERDDFAHAAEVNYSEYLEMKQERDTLKAENADLLAALQVVKEDRQKWWGVAVERNRQICDLKAELQSNDDHNTRLRRLLMDENYDLRAQLDTSREEGYLAGMERAAEMLENRAEYGDTLMSTELKLQAAAIRAESSTLPRTTNKEN